MKTCPSCSAALEHYPGVRFSAEICPGCGGIWFDPGQFGAMMYDQDLRALTEQDHGPSGHDATHTPTTCPSCKHELAQHAYADSAIKLYRCATCGGIFLPYDQLNLLLHRQIGLTRDYVARHGPYDNLPPEVREAAATLDAMTIGTTLKTQHFIDAMHSFMRPWGWWGYGGW